MPKALDPSARVPIWLDSDAEKPEAERPMFFCKAMSTREWNEVIEVADHKVEDAPGMIAQVFTALRMAIVDWSNMGGVEFSQSVFEHVLTPGEAQELLQKVVRSPFLSPDDKKKSESPAPSSPASSVATAPADASKSPIEPSP